MPIVERAILQAGGDEAVSRACRLKSRQAVLYWRQRQRLPHTDLYGKTNYAAVIERLQRDAGVPDERLVTKNQLLEASRSVA